jgi:hypothetical protein
MAKKTIENQGTSRPQGPSTVDASKPAKETVKPIDYKQQTHGHRETPARAGNTVVAK